MFVFDGPNKRIHIEASAVVNGAVQFNVTELWSRYVDWLAIGDNSKYQQAMSVIGGQSIGGGQYVGTYLFFRNDLGWRGVPPAIDGTSIVIDGAFYPQDSTLPVLENLPDQETSLVINRSAIVFGMDTSGTPAPTAAEIAAAVWANTTGAAVATRLAEAWGRLGLNPSAPLVTGTTSISFGDIVMAMTGDATSTTVTRQ